MQERINALLVYCSTGWMHHKTGRKNVGQIGFSRRETSVILANNGLVNKSKLFSILLYHRRNSIRFLGNRYYTVASCYNSREG